MVRTKDTAGVKVVGAKSSRKAPPPAAPAPAAAGESSSKNKYAGGNPYCPRETPAWQKPITQFFTATSPRSGGESSSEGCSGASSSCSVEAIGGPSHSGSGEGSGEIQED